MIHERIRKRLTPDRPMTSVTFSIPKDVLDDLDDMASHLGFSGHPALIRSYISEGMRRDEEKVYFTPSGEEVTPMEIHSEGFIGAAGSLCTAS